MQQAVVADGKILPRFKMQIYLIKGRKILPNHVFFTRQNAVDFVSRLNKLSKIKYEVLKFVPDDPDGAKALAAKRLNLSYYQVRQLQSKLLAQFIREKNEIL